MIEGKNRSIYSFIEAGREVSESGDSGVGGGINLFSVSYHTISTYSVVCVQALQGVVRDVLLHCCC